MKRTWHIWAVFAACSLCLVATLGWLSGKALELDRSEAAARTQAELEESSRLALWRMDSLMASLIASESAQSPSFYSPFLAAAGPAAARNSNEGRVPSPLRLRRHPYVLLHFEIDSAHRVTSPQVADRVGPTTAGNPTDHELATLHKRLEHLRHQLRADEVASRLPEWKPQEMVAINPESMERFQQMPETTKQTIRSNSEFNARSQLLNTAQTQNAGNGLFDQAPHAAPLDGSMGPMTAVWLEDSLFLARRSEAGGKFTLQGCWLDWAQIRKDLLESIQDLLPAANLVAVENPDATGQSRLMATLPLRLEVGTSPASVLLGTLTPVRLALIVMWGSLLCVVGMSALLLRGVIALNERRAAFVSAVTHEMRTPLTTFRMYSEMLAEGMVPQESDRTRYFETLRTESDRLVHLVENVLAYARLERGAAAGRTRSIPVHELIEAVRTRLEERARSCDMPLVINAEDAADAVVVTDAGAVEQILFNLVDNACKYAATPRGFRIFVSHHSKVVTFAVEDEGPGVSGEVRRRLFQPFHKSASEAARTAPGVGLGLALCRRLARELRGDLRLVTKPNAGARFELDLPAVG
jgi:signal transduction histidine kinase